MDLTVVDSVYPPRLAEIAFQSAGERLNGLLYVAAGAGPHPVALLLHGNPGNERNFDIAQAVRRAGYTVLSDRDDFRRSRAGRLQRHVRQRRAERRQSISPRFEPMYAGNPGRMRDTR